MKKTSSVRLDVAKGEKPAVFQPPPAATPNPAPAPAEKTAQGEAMSEPHAAPFRLSDDQDADLVQYHALSRLAVAGLVLGLLSAFAVLTPMLWIVPGLGVIVSGTALWQIRRHAPALAGRRLAQGGLLLSIALGVAVPVDWLAYRHLIRKEARQFAAMWFDISGARPAATGLPVDVAPQPSPAAGRKTGRLRSRSARARERLNRYADLPLVRKLLAIGRKQGFQVRYDRSGSQGADEESEYVDLIYAVSVDQPEGKTTFFVELGLAHQARLRPGQLATGPRRDRRARRLVKKGGGRKAEGGRKERMKDQG